MKKFVKIGLVCTAPLPILLIMVGAPLWLVILSGISLLGFGMAYLPGVHIVTNSNPNRSVNTAYDSDSQFWMSVNYTIVTSVTNPLAIGSSSAFAYLDISMDGGSTWPTTINNVGQSSGNGVSVLIQYIQGANFILTGLVPPGVKYRIRTATTGTASVSAPTSSQQELTFG